MMMEMRLWEFWAMLGYWTFFCLALGNNRLSYKLSIRGIITVALSCLVFWPVLPLLYWWLYSAIEKRETKWLEVLRERKEKK